MYSTISHAIPSRPTPAKPTLGGTASKSPSVLQPTYIQMYESSQYRLMNVRDGVSAGSGNRGRHDPAHGDSDVDYSRLYSMYVHAYTPAYANQAPYGRNRK